MKQLWELESQYVIDMETIKEILLLEQQRNLVSGLNKLLRSKRVKHPEAYVAYRDMLDLDRENWRRSS